MTLAAIYMFFSLVCYLAYGDSIAPIVTEMLPLSGWTSLVKILFCINLVFSYSILIYPTNSILESYLFSRRGLTLPSRRWAKNFSRFIICISAASITVWLEGNLNKFLGLLGALLCGPLALTIPAALHLKVLAKTKCEKIVDLSLLLLSGLVLVFCTA